MRRLGSSKRPLGSLFGSPGGPWGLLERSWELFGGSWEALGNISERSWEHFGCFWEVFGDYFGCWKASLKRFAEILKNLEKHCKVLQKSRFGGS